MYGQALVLTLSRRPHKPSSRQQCECMRDTVRLSLNSTYMLAFNCRTPLQLTYIVFLKEQRYYFAAAKWNSGITWNFTPGMNYLQSFVTRNQMRASVTSWHIFLPGHKRVSSLREATVSRDDSIVVALPSNILPENKTTGFTQIMLRHGDGRCHRNTTAQTHPSILFYHHLACTQARWGAGAFPTCLRKPLVQGFVHSKIMAVYITIWKNKAPDWDQRCRNNSPSFAGTWVEIKQWWKKKVRQTVKIDRAFPQ